MAVGYIGYQIRNPALPLTQQAHIAAADAVYWNVELLGDREELRVNVRDPRVWERGKTYELWVLPTKEGGAPVSLGLLPRSGEARRVLSAAQRAALAGASQLAVSIEPDGGSPTGLPTGPVVHVVPLVPAPA